jgi:hypothetical protein
MSSYDTSTASFTTVVRPTNAELVRSAIGDHVTGRLAGWTGSAGLLALGDRATQLGRLDAAALVTSAREVRDLLGDRPVAEAIVRAAHRDLLGQADAQLGLVRTRAAAGDEAGAATAAREASRMLGQALRSTAVELAGEERTLTVEASQRSLAALGWTAEVHPGDRATGVWAVRGDEAVAILVQDGGAIETDVVGCAGDTCAPVMEAFRRQMEAEGVLLSEVARRPHGDSEGGQLIARARRVQGDSSMAAGIVAQFERRATTSAEERTAAPGRIAEHG